MQKICYCLATDGGPGPEVTLDYSAGNLEIAQAEAWMGEYTLTDDGLPAPEPTLEARVSETEEALALLLSGVTE